MRQIRFLEAKSGLSTRCVLLSNEAPRSTEFLWQLAAGRPEFEAIHAIWTGPELSCPLPASVLPPPLAEMTIPEENATSFPDPGDVVLASLPAGSIKALPPGNFFDVGLFYAPGGRLLMPFGWIKANVCARIVAEDFESFQACMKTIRRNGACKLQFERVE